jgi:hypothetical protein
MATFRPDSASVKSTWHDKREVPWRTPAGPVFIDIDVTGGAGAKASANRGDAVIEFTQNLHHLQTGFCLDVMFLPVPVHYDHPRH